MSDHPLDADTVVEPAGDHRYTATITDRWNAIGARPNGGYVLAICLQALRHRHAPVRALPAGIAKSYQITTIFPHLTVFDIGSPRGPLRFDPKNHNPISDIHMPTVQANPLRHVVTDVLKDVRHPNGGGILEGDPLA